MEFVVMSPWDDTRLSCTCPAPCGGAVHDTRVEDMIVLTLDTLPNWHADKCAANPVPVTRMMAEAWLTMAGGFDESTTGVPRFR